LDKSPHHFNKLVGGSRPNRVTIFAHHPLRDEAMPVDTIRYDLLTQDALRGVIRTVLTTAAAKGLPGDHHFFITFDTRAEGVRMSTRLKASYPEEMTIVLQHQFWDLTIGEEDFEVGLAFNGIPERLHVPLKAVKAFLDPSVQFGLQFTVEPEAGAAKAETPGAAAVPATERKKPKPELKQELKREPRLEPRQEPKPELKQEPKSPEPQEAPAPAKGKKGDAAPATTGEVVRLDRFRKK
jgi:uncharacterized protein